MKRIKSLFGNEFIRNVFSLVKGSTVSQAFSLLFSPFLTRLYTPADFGLFFIFIVSSGLFSVFQTGALEKAIIVNKSIYNSGRILTFSLLLIAFLSTAVIVLYPFYLVVSEKFIGSHLSFVLLLLFLLNALTLAFSRLFSAVNNRTKKYNVIAKAVVLRAVFIILFQIFFGIMGLNHYGLIIGAVVGNLFASLFLLLKTSINLKFFNLSRIKQSFDLIRGQKDFMFFEMPSSLLNEISVIAPLYFYKFFFGETFTGIYSLPQKVLSQPMQLLGRSVSEVFIRKAAEQENGQNGLDVLAFSSFQTLFYLGIVPFTIIALWGEPIFEFVFGVEWGMSGLIASILVPWQIFVLAGSPVSNVFITKGKMKLSYRLNMFLVFLRLLALVIGVFYFKDFISTVLVFSMVSSLYWIFLSLFSLKMAGVDYEKSALFLLKVTIIPIVLVLIKYLYV